MPLALTAMALPAYVLTVVLLWPVLGPLSLLAGTLGASLAALLTGLWVMFRRRDASPSDTDAAVHHRRL